MSTNNTEEVEFLKPDYLANYGLTHAPFSNQHDDRFLYLDAERAQRLNLLQHMTQYSNLLLIVKGEKGVGKTSLLTRFVNAKADNWYICQLSANSFMDAGQLLFLVAQGFGVERMPNDNSELQEMLYARIATYHHNGQIPILLIDNAQELPKDALLTIFHLADTQVDNANLMRIILFSEPQIEKMLNAREVRALRERITHTMVIPALNEDATAEYLKHRMAVAGFDGSSPFTPKMIKRIYIASEGIPEQINQLAHETLDRDDFECEELEDIVKPVQPRRLDNNKARALIGIGVILLALVLVFHNQVSRLFGVKSTQTTTLPLPLADNTPEIHPEAQTKPIPTVTPTALAQPTASSAPILASTEKPALQEKIIPLHPTATKPAHPAPASVPAVSPAKADSATVSTNKTAQVPVSPGMAVSTNPALTAKTTTTVSRNKSKTQDWILSQKPGMYTLQLFGSHEKKNIEDFIRQYQLGEQANYFASIHKGQQWFSVVYGAYPDSAAARAAITTLPGSLRKIKPWVRRFGDIQASIHSSRESTQASPTKPRRPHVEQLPAGSVFTTALPKHANLEQYASWLWSQDPGYFTLQLLGARELAGVKNFLKQYPKLAAYIVYFRSHHQGHDWYAVVYGVYSDKQKAREAIKRLPRSLQKATPWIRSFASVQADLSRTK